MASGQELNVENAQIRTRSDRQKEQILAECQAQIKKHEFQVNYNRRSVQKLKQKNFNDDITAKFGIT